ncbi:MAG: MGMT family protein [Myxococcota bacterium]
MAAVEPGFAQQVYAVVNRIPPGRVCTYGDVAAVLGNRRWARRVGWALGRLSETQAKRVPWQRVINAQGRISLKDDLLRGDLQHGILMEEGIEFDENGRCDLARVRCLPEDLLP